MAVKAEAEVAVSSWKRFGRLLWRCNEASNSAQTTTAVVGFCRSRATPVVSLPWMTALALACVVLLEAATSPKMLAGPQSVGTKSFLIF